MSSLIGTLSLLLTLAATSHALSCTQCMSAGSSTCSGNSRPCPSGHQCGSQYSETLVGGMTTQAIIRICTPSFECDTKGGVSTSGLQLRIGISCCNTDDCTPNIPALTTKGTNPNGLVCRSCISADSTWCYTSDTVQCTGDEDMCLLQTTKISGSMSSSAAIRGCATKSLCDLGNQTETFAGFTMEVKTICTNSSNSVHNAGRCVVSASKIVLLIVLFKVFLEE